MWHRCLSVMQTSLTCFQGRLSATEHSVTLFLDEGREVN